MPPKGRGAWPAAHSPCATRDISLLCTESLDAVLGTHSPVPQAVLPPPHEAPPQPRRAASAHEPATGATESGAASAASAAAVDGTADPATAAHPLAPQPPPARSSPSFLSDESSESEGLEGSHDGSPSKARRLCSAHTSPGRSPPPLLGRLSSFRRLTACSPSFTPRERGGRQAPREIARRPALGLLPVARRGLSAGSLARGGGVASPKPSAAAQVAPSSSRGSRLLAAAVAEQALEQARAEAGQDVRPDVRQDVGAERNP